MLCKVFYPCKDIMTETFKEGLRSGLKDHIKDRPSDLSDSEDANLELEIRLGAFQEDARRGKGGDRYYYFSPKLPLVTFKEIIEALRRQSEQLGLVVANIEPSQSLTLDVSLDNQNKFLPKSLRNARSTIESGSIGEFCSTNTTPLENKVSLHKKDLRDWGLRIQSSQESPVVEERLKERFDEILSDRRYHKFYRLKNRRSFIGEGFRVDATVVKEGRGPSYELANIARQPEHYEIEIERIPGSDGNYTPLTEASLDAWFEKIFPTVQLLKRIQEGAPQVVSEEEKKQAKVQYKVAFFDEEERTRPVRNDRRLFVGMEVHPLEPNHVIENTNGKIPLVTGEYYVTVKADGMRNLLFFAENGRGYLIDRGMNIRWSGLAIPDLAGAAFDGEYLPQQGRFLIFDYLLSPGSEDLRDSRDLRDRPFEERLAQLKTLYAETIARETAGGALKLELKNHHLVPQADSLQEALGVIENDESLGLLDRVLKEAEQNGYEEDGFIFTPNEPYPRATLSEMVKWPNLLKWKSPRMLTNDFKVRKQRSRVTGQPELYRPANSDRDYQTLLLSSSYQGVPKKFMNASKGFIDGVDNVARVVVDERGVIRTTEDKQVIYDDNIVEFAWRTLPEKDVFPGREKGWMPIRARYDKRTPNRIETARSNWELIRKHPITYDMLKGEVKIPFDYYYTQVDDRLKGLTQRMRSFHNQVKGDLINSAADAVREDQIARGVRPEEVQIRLLDLGVGQGGDLYKWNKAGITTALGIDKFQENLEQTDGAIDRYLQNKERDPEDFKVDATFVWGDGSQNIKKSLAISAEQDTQDSTAGNKDYHNVLLNYFKENSPGFHIVSVQFALHYFMESEEKIRNLLRNVSEQLLPGGYFIGTTMDGAKVHLALNKSGRGQISGKRTFNRGRGGGKATTNLWSIRRKYDPKEVEDSEEIGLGRQVDVMNISIGSKEIPEWLVDFGALGKIASEYGLTTVGIGEFGTEGIGSFADYDPVQRHRVKGKKPAKEAMSEPERQYSFLNSYFIFQKGGSTPPAPETTTAPVPVAAAPTPARPIVTTTPITTVAAPTPVATTPATPAAPATPSAATTAPTPSQPVRRPPRLRIPIKRPTSLAKGEEASSSASTAPLPVAPLPVAPATATAVAPLPAAAPAVPAPAAATAAPRVIPRPPRLLRPIKITKK